MPETNSSTTNQPVSLADEEAVKEILVSTMFSLWDGVNNRPVLKGQAMKIASYSMLVVSTRAVI